MFEVGGEPLLELRELWDGEGGDVEGVLGLSGRLGLRHVGGWVCNPRLALK